MDRSAALASASPLLMRAAAGAAHHAASGQASLKRKVPALRERIGPDEALRARVPFLAVGADWLIEDVVGRSALAA